MTRRFTITDLQPWCEVRFDRASGPGGQHVNKVNTRATLLFDFQQCPLLTDVQRNRIAQRCTSRLAHDGRLRIVAQQDRSQAANRALAEERLVEILAQALHVERPRRPTKPTAGAKRRRLEAKKQRGDLKRQRQNPDW